MPGVLAETHRDVEPCLQTRMVQGRHCPPIPYRRELCWREDDIAYEWALRAPLLTVGKPNGVQQKSGTYANLAIRFSLHYIANANPWL